VIKRTIEVSGRGNHLSISQGSLVVARDGEQVGRVPLEDLGLLVVDAADTTYTHWVLTEALAAGAAVLLCGRNHHPAGLLLSQTNWLHTQRLHQQIAASKPLQKGLWKQIVQAKIRHQAQALGADRAEGRALEGLISTVRSGDPTNVEAQAARKYWRPMFGEAFRRDPEGQPPNYLLNYGYTVLRAAVARAVCGAGLHPALGLHHRNRSNAFCLADDMLEPLRPLVDVKVRELADGGNMEIDQEAKTELLSLLTATVEIDGQNGPLMVALERMTASLVRCYAGEDRKLVVPKLWPN